MQINELVEVSISYDNNIGGFYTCWYAAKVNGITPDRGPRLVFLNPKLAAEYAKTDRSHWVFPLLAKNKFPNIRRVPKGQDEFPRLPLSLRYPIYCKKQQLILKLLE
jgi:hypothetical protein